MLAIAHPNGASDHNDASRRRGRALHPGTGLGRRKGVTRKSHGHVDT